MKHTYIIIAIITLFTACVKDNKCSETNRVTVKTNSPVGAGESLTLSASGVKKAYTYIWHFPNGSISHEKNPVIDQTSSDFAGVYTVDVITTGGCSYSGTSDSVIIENPVSACNLSDNTFELDNVVSTSLYYVAGHSTGDRYVIEGDGNGGDITLEFTGAKINSGIYRVLAFGENHTAGTVDVTRVYGRGYLWNLNPGNKISVSITNGKATVSYCDLEFISTNDGSKVKGRLKMTEQ